MVEEPKELEQRFVLAKEFVDELDPEHKVSCFVDGIENEAMRYFNAFPERIYIINDGKIAYVGGIGPFFYSLEELEN